ncbi:MAG: hypothetical protein ACI4E1_12165 [Lachnospira sp.]
MGKSKSIQQHVDTNEEFQIYLKKLQASMVEKVEKDNKDFIDKVNSFYEGKSYVTMQEGERWDYRQRNEFNLDSISEAVKGIVDSTFDSQDDDKKKEKPDQEYKELAFQIGKNIVLNALNIFKASSTIEYSHSYTAETVCPGLTLHMLVATDSYSDSHWLGSENIIESYIVYKLIYSKDVAEADVEIDLFRKQKLLIQAYNETLCASENAFMTKLLTGEVSETELIAHSNITLYMRNSIQDCMNILGIGRQVKAVHRSQNDLMKLNALLSNEMYSNEGKQALRKLLEN